MTNNAHQFFFFAFFFQSKEDIEKKKNFRTRNNKMLIIKLSAVFICLVSISFMVERADAWKKVFQLGDSEGNNRKKLQSEVYKLDTSPNCSMSSRYTMQGNRYNTIRDVIVYRKEDDSKMKIDEDYFVGVIGGDLAKEFITMNFIMGPNPDKEPVHFEVELYHVN